MRRVRAPPRQLRNWCHCSLPTARPRDAQRPDSVGAEAVSGRLGFWPGRSRIFLLRPGSWHIIHGPIAWPSNRALQKRANMYTNYYLVERSVAGNGLTNAARRLGCALRSISGAVELATQMSRLRHKQVTTVRLIADCSLYHTDHRSPRW